MDNSKVIYEKKFPHLSAADCERLYAEVNTDFMAAAKKRSSTVLQAAS